MICVWCSYMQFYKNVTIKWTFYLKFCNFYDTWGIRQYFETILICINLFEETDEHLNLMKTLIWIFHNIFFIGVLEIIEWNVLNRNKYEFQSFRLYSLHITNLISITRRILRWLKLLDRSIKKIKINFLYTKVDISNKLGIVQVAWGSSVYT